MKTKAPEATDTEPLYDEHVKEWERHRETLHLPKKRQPSTRLDRRRRRRGRARDGRG